jgi:hypothetical protein
MGSPETNRDVVMRLLGEEWARKIGNVRAGITQTLMNQDRDRGSMFDIIASYLIIIAKQKKAERVTFNELATRVKEIMTGDPKTSLIPSQDEEVDWAATILQQEMEKQDSFVNDLNS